MTSTTQVEIAFTSQVKLSLPSTTQVKIAFTSQVNYLSNIILVCPQKLSKDMKLHHMHRTHMLPKVKCLSPLRASPCHNHSHAGFEPKTTLGHRSYSILIPNVKTHIVCVYIVLQACLLYNKKATLKINTCVKT